MSAAPRTLQTFKRFVKFDQPGAMLGMEIGCFEGRTTLALLDWMSHASAQMICVDPFLDRYLPDSTAFDARWSYFAGQKGRFDENTASQRHRIILKQGLSQEVLPQLLADYKDQLDFVFIDGDHRAKAVYLDGVNALKLVRPGGYLVFDDYKWGHNLSPEFYTAVGIDRFLNEFADAVAVVHKNGQVVVKKK